MSGTPRAAAASPPWWIVFTRELRELWLGGKALTLVLIYTVLLGIYSYLFASNAELNLLPGQLVVLEIVKAAIFFGLFICLIIAADSVSGERERATLEGLLLTPVSRRQIVVGKFLAALSPWPVTIAIAIPYWVVLSHGDRALGPALSLGPVLGSLLAPAVTGLALLISVWCNSNKTSMIVSLGAYLLLMLPAEFGGVTVLAGGVAPTASTAPLQWVNPIAAVEWVLRGQIMAGTPLESQWIWLAVPLLLAVAIPATLFLVSGREVRLDAATSRFGSMGTHWGRLFGETRRRSAPERVLHDRLPESAQAATGGDGPAGTFRSRPVRTTGFMGAWPGWWLVCSRELRDLWMGGRALVLLLLYTVIVGVASFLSASRSQFDLIPPKEMVFSTVQISIYVGVFMGVILGADSLSGARERAVLETLLLTPIRRRSIVVGKFLACSSPWPAALAVTVPCLAVLAQGDPIVGRALLWGVIIGSLLVLGFTGLGVLVSFWSNSNKTSLFVSLTLYLVFLLPSLLPGQAQKGLVGKFFQRSNPLAAADEFLEKILVNNRTVPEFQSWLQGPVVFPILVIGLLFLYAAPRLRLYAGRARTIRPRVPPAVALSAGGNAVAIGGN